MHGHCESGFGRVAEVFAAQLESGRDIGGSVGVYLDGKPVVEIWGGSADPRSGVPWAQHTVTPIGSTEQGARLDRGVDLGRSGPGRSQRTGGALLAGVRPEWQGGHPRSSGALAPIRGRRPRRTDQQRSGRCARSGAAAHRATTAVVAARHEARLPRGDVRLHPERPGPRDHRAYGR